MTDPTNLTGTDAPSAGTDAPPADVEKLTPEQVEEQITEALKTDAATGPRTTEQSFADSMIDVAITLRVDSRDHLKRTTANRDLLRNLKTMGVLTATQNTAVDLLYPERTKKVRESGAGQGTSTAPDGVHVQVNPASAAAKRAAKPAPEPVTA